MNYELQVMVCTILSLVVSRTLCCRRDVIQCSMWLNVSVQRLKATIHRCV